MPTPKINHILFCEDLRIEQGGKASLLGFLGVAPLVQLGVPSFEVPAGKLILLIGIEPIAEPHTLELRLLKPNGEILKHQPIKLVPAHTNAMAVALVFETLPFTEEGIFPIVILENDEEIYRTSISIQLSSNLAPQPAPA